MVQNKNLLILLAAAFIFSGCTKNKNSSVQSEYAQRIVSLSPAATEILYAIGAQEQIVAVSELSDYPPECRDKPFVGGFDGKTLSLERILSFKPDLVYLTNVMHNHLIPQLEQYGIKYYLSTTESVEAICKEILDIGVLTGHEMESVKLAYDINRGVAGGTPAEGVAEKTGASEASEDFGAQGEASPSLTPSIGCCLRNELDEGEASPSLTPSIGCCLRNELDEEETSPVLVYYEVWNSPYMTCGKPSFIDDVIKTAGGMNIFGDVEEAYPVISEESIILRKPDVILIPASAGLSVESVCKRRGWGDIPAVQNNRIFIIDDNLYTRAGPRIALVIQDLRKILGTELVTQAE